MFNESEKAYCRALLALKDKDYHVAADCFEKAAPFFENNVEFQLLMETNRLLLLVKENLAAMDADDDIEIEETITYGQETELR